MTLVAILGQAGGARGLGPRAPRRRRDGAHGGRREGTVVVSPAEPPDRFRKIHVVTCPDAAAVRAYRADPTAPAHDRDVATPARP